MAELVKPWEDAGSLSVTYDGVGDGSAVFSSDVAEGLDREMRVSFVDKYRSVVVERKVTQVGMREEFVCADGDFILADGGTFNVLKAPKKKYQRVEYIASDVEGAYIDTGFMPNNNTRLVIDYQGEDLSDAAVYVLGTIERNKNAMFQIQVASSGNKYTHNWGASSKASGVAIGSRIVIDINKNVATYGTTVVTMTNAEFQSDSNLALLGGTNSSGTLRASAGTIYSCKIYDNDVLIRDFVPALWEDEKVGLVDVLTDTFYPSAGDIEFIAGEIIEE